MECSHTFHSRPHSHVRKNTACPLNSFASQPAIQPMESLNQSVSQWRNECTGTHGYAMRYARLSRKQGPTLIDRPAVGALGRMKNPPQHKTLTQTER